MGVDDRITEELERLAEPGSAEPGLIERLERRKRRYRLARRAQAVTLVVAVLAGTAGGGWALYKAFRPDRTTPVAPSVRNGLIAFVSDHEGKDDIYVASPEDSRNLRRLTNDAASETGLAWSNDGRLLAFLSARDGGIGLFVMQADGSGRRHVPTPEQMLFPPMWTPEGTLGYIALVGEKETAIIIVDLEGNEMHRITPPINQPDQSDAEPPGPGWYPLLPFDWSPDGTQIVTPGAGGLWFFDLNGNRTDFVPTEETFDSVDWSPDGSRIAFASGMPSVFAEGHPSKGRATHIAVLDLGTRRISQITREDSVDGSPAWSPDGQSIVFTRQPTTYDGKSWPESSLYVVEPGGDPRPFLEGEGSHSDPAWQPIPTTPAPEPSLNTPTPEPPRAPATAEGKIAFVAEQPDGKGDLDIFAIEPDGRGITALSREGGWERDPAWSPDGQRIAYVGGRDRSELYIRNADGSGLRKVTHNNTAEYQPSWSPDGRQIAVSIQGEHPSSVQIVDIETGAMRMLVESGASDPDWSPDGSLIAYVGQGPEGQPDLFVIEPGGSGMRRVTNDQAIESGPAWSPDGYRILFSRGGDLFVSEASGRSESVITRTPEMENSPEWSPDGEWIAYESNASVGGVFVSRSDGSQPRLLYGGAGSPAWQAFATDGSVTPPESCGFPPETFTVHGLEFDPDCMQLAPGTRLRLRFANLDEGIPHNLSIYRQARGTQPEWIELIFRGDIVPGPETVTYETAELEAGTYRFQCDLHPSVMNGQLIVA